MIDVDNQYIDEATDNLFGLLGIKENISHDSLWGLFRKGKIKECIYAIANYLGLPIEVNLFYVPSDYRPSSNGPSQAFTSHQLVKTDSTGRGIEAITAQISIPGNLPLFGTSSFVKFPIDVKVSKNIKEYPDTFMAIIAHELSHILLHSLRYQEKDNEIYTDITAMLLGFNKIVSRGRKTVKIEQHFSSSTTTTTTTTTYGYLSDAQFSFASGKIIRILKQNRNIKKRLDKKIEVLKKKSGSFKKIFTKFKKYIRFLDEHPPKKISQQDAKKIVLLHQPGYIENFENSVKVIKGKVGQHQGYKSHKHYYPDWHVELEKDLDLLVSEIKKVVEPFEKDFDILKRNMKFIDEIKVGFKNFLKL